ncbi:matrixin family metalloprotease [Rhodospirillaceae bacterium]|nr:matrixin family metalloprotease [Rhodospirillaceae bacterium]
MEGNQINFEIFDQKWGNSQINGEPGGIVTYSFATQNLPFQFGTFDSFILDKNYQADITESFSIWENVADIRFSEVLDGPSVNIRFGWREFDGEFGVLGATTIPVSGPLSAVVIALDSDEDWIYSGSGQSGEIRFSTTVIHEIGHAIGINHSFVSNAIMAERYSSSTSDLQQDDISAVETLYGENDISKTDIYRFYNPLSGGHFFTADVAEKNVLDGNGSFSAEGVGFESMSKDMAESAGVVPVYRFFNTNLGSHFFTASEQEKDHVLDIGDFNFEGVGFRAFSEDSASTEPVYRFFNVVTGGHFFTVDKNERDVVSLLSQFRYEGEAFYAFVDNSL